MIAEQTLQYFKRASRRFSADQGGLALVEFAYAAPILILLTFGGAELANVAITHTRISGITSTVADGIARVRDRIDEVDVNDVITGAKLSGSSLNLTTRGRIVISTVEDNAATTSNTTDQIITWQRCKGLKNVATSDTIGAQGAVLTTGIGPTGRQISATPGNPVIIVEIFHDYQPIMTDMIETPATIKYRSAFSVRDRTLQTLQNAQNLTGASVANCSLYNS